MRCYQHIAMVIGAVVLMMFLGWIVNAQDISMSDEKFFASLMFSGAISILAQSLLTTGHHVLAKRMGLSPNKFSTLSYVPVLFCGAFVSFFIADVIQHALNASHHVPWVIYLSGSLVVTTTFTAYEWLRLRETRDALTDAQEALI